MKTRTKKIGGISDDRLSKILLQHAQDLRGFVQKHIPKGLAAQIAAEDILQEVWIAAFRANLSLGRIQGGGLPLWLRTVARRKLLDAIKNAARVRRGGGGRGIAVGLWDIRSSSGLGILPGVKSPSQEIAIRDISQAVRAAIAGLPDSQRAAMLHHIDGMTLDQ